MRLAELYEWVGGGIVVAMLATKVDLVRGGRTWENKRITMS
jgi:hypothetical protein